MFRLVTSTVCALCTFHICFVGYHTVIQIRSPFKSWEGEFASLTSVWCITIVLKFIVNGECYLNMLFSFLFYSLVLLVTFIYDIMAGNYRWKTGF